MRIALLTFTLIALLIPAAAHASPRQVMTFEAPDELYDDTRRDATLDEIRAFGVTQIRQLVYWQQFAPGANRKRKPRFNASDPERLSGARAARPADRAATGRGIKVILTPTGPVPRWATEAKKGHLNRPSAKQFGQFVTALARRYGAQVETWSVWNEPNQPQFLMPQYRKGKPASPPIYRELYRAAHRAIRSVRENRRDKILIGETSPRGNENVLHPLTFLRGVTCLDRSTRRPARAPAARRRLRPPRLHDACRSALRAVRQERRHDRGARAAGGRARSHGRARGCPRAEDLPDGVRDPVRARPDLGRLVRASARLLRDRRAHGLRELARRAVLAVPDARRRSARGGLPVPRLRERPAAQQRPTQAGLPRVPEPARGRALRPHRRAVGPDPPAGGRDARDDRGAPARPQVARPAPAQHHLARRLRPARAPSQQAGVPRALDRPARKRHTGPPIRAYKLGS